MCGLRRKSLVQTIWWLSGAVGWHMAVLKSAEERMYRAGSRGPAEQVRRTGDFTGQ